MCKKNQSLYQKISNYLNENKSFQKFLENWLISLQNLPAKLAKGEMKLYKSKKANINENLFLIRNLKILKKYILAYRPTLFNTSKESPHNFYLSIYV